MKYDDLIKRILESQIQNKSISYCFELSIYEQKNKKIDCAEDIFFNYVSKVGPNVVFENVQPKYVLETDTIHIPTINHFSNSFEYYYILFHEISHSTMIDNRIPRVGILDSHFEEIVSELSSAFITSEIFNWVFPQSEDFIRHHLNESEFSDDKILQLEIGRNIAISIAQFILKGGTNAML